MTRSDSTPHLPDGWSEDFDLYDPGYLSDPSSVWGAMRTECPVATSSRRGGGVMLSRHADIATVALDTDTFSSRAIEVTGPVPEPGRGLQIPPVTSDPPAHPADRRILMPFFTRRAVARWEPLTRDTANALLDEIVARDVVDASEAFSRDIPVIVTARLLGLPREDEPKYHDWTVRMLKDGAEDFDVRAAAIGAIRDHLRGLLVDPSGLDKDGVIHFLLDRRAEDPELTDERVLGMSFLMLIAGIDTTWSALNSSLWHLATHPRDRETLAADPSRIPQAIEEFLRVYAPVTVGRVVRTETRLGGHHLCPGQRVVVPWGAANLDPAEVDEPGEVRIDRERNRHLTFGLGIHRCLGAPLAQLELRVALEEWLRRIPEFTLASPETVTWTGGNTRGPENLLLRLGAG